MDFGSWKVAFSALPVDWLIIAALVILIAFDSLRSGTARAAALALALPATMLLTSVLPKAFFLGPLSEGFKLPTGQLLIFGAVFVVLYIACYRTIFAFADGGGVLQSLLAGFGATIILIVVWLEVPALGALWHLGDQVQAVFGETYRFWWLAGAYIALAFVRS